MRLRFKQISLQSDRNQPHLSSIFLDLNRDSAQYGLAMQKSLTLNDAELKETFSRASGPGGQNVNKVSTRVTLRHLPTNITVTVQESRHQAQNRQLARERLLAALQQREQQAKAAVRHQREKARRQNSKRPKRVKERILDSKRHRSKTKKERSWKTD